MSSDRSADDARPMCAYWRDRHWQYWTHPVTGMVLCAICRPPRGLAPIEVVE